MGSMLSIFISLFLSDNLILIRENMTWNEALSYCREHHVDLVSITTELLQSWVTERAASATSSQVWVGLRFTCSFHFWFWIRSDAGCYQNWAPGNGSDSQQDCGIAGAVETTGRQQWVSLEENQRLNFICYKCSGNSGEGLIHL
ncbi:macrophage mannose receptor 1-like [Salmo salar]|uniref:Macrophage mannose receptor 1-like n=1 Tax=Salmo salar TaxID=8030 RepID=A0ABM3D386_SALSA|nr:macrophage mannose receptor 1-like [Salmo salar]